MAGIRELLQVQDYQKLAGISVGGWITLSALAGILLGSALTLLVQWYRRRKQLRYMDAVPLNTDYLSAAPLHKQVSAATASQLSPAPLKPRLPAAPGAQPKYYSPLTKSMSVGAQDCMCSHHTGGHVSLSLGLTPTAGPCRTRRTCRPVRTTHSHRQLCRARSHMRQQRPQVALKPAAP
ncbi:hypothetical protein COO60DRAFT_412349 [Scenedesmus sp. NREL 46B-D3]|nr:hypothetical protein COO60DRAFT_412349 [Scenedesmus sp. NREL 46B-D3]